MHTDVSEQRLSLVGDVKVPACRKPASYAALLALSNPHCTLANHE